MFKLLLTSCVMFCLFSAAHGGRLTDEEYCAMLPEGDTSHGFCDREWPGPFYWFDYMVGKLSLISIAFKPLARDHACKIPGRERCACHRSETYCFDWKETKGSFIGKRLRGI